MKGIVYVAVFFIVPYVGYLKGVFVKASRCEARMRNNAPKHGLASAVVVLDGIKE